MTNLINAVDVFQEQLKTEIKEEVGSTRSNFFEHPELAIDPADVSFMDQSENDRDGRSDWT